MTISAWYMDDDTTSDQRLPHHKSPPEYVTSEKLLDLGVLHWEGIEGEDDPKLEKIKQDRGYTYNDIISCCPEKLPDYEKKIASFFEEHIHYDEEIRLCLDGSGYFDVRDPEDRWIRVALAKGDMIIIPEGLYHRFSNDEGNYIKAMRLFVGEPVWTPYNRTDITEENASRVKYVEKFVVKEETVKRQKVEEVV